RSYPSYDVWRNEIRRALQVCRFAVMVIRQAQPERRDSYPLKHAAERDVPVPFAIPLRKHNHREILARIEEFAPYRVVFRIRRFDRAVKLQNVSIESVIGCRLIRVKCGTIEQRP